MIAHVRRDISPTAFLVSDCDEMYISGWGGQTNSSNSAYASQSTTSGLPTTEGAFQLARTAVILAGCCTGRRT